MKNRLWLSAAAVLAMALPCLGQQNLFQDGDRICYIGSSIAMNGQCFHFINLFYATRYPDRTIHFVNGGISGDNTDGILARLDSDILASNPTHCVVMIEENDLRPALYRQDNPNSKKLQEDAVQHWMKNTDLIVEKLRSHDVKVILQTPTIYDETAKTSTANAPGINNNLKRCADHLKELAAKDSLLLVDCWTALNEVNKRIQKDDPTKSIIGRDRVHVSSQGFFVMANEFLRSQKVDGVVSRFVIDAPGNKTTLSENCTVSGLNAKPTSVSFTATAKSLPFPTPSDIQPDQFFDFTDELNADILQVKGLEKGTYTLDIGGTTIGKFSEEELSKGVNLSKYHNTPQYKQAERILEKFGEYWKDGRTLRSLKYVEYEFPKLVKGTKNLDEAKANMAAYLEKQKSSANYSFFTNMFKSYTDNKASEQALTERSEEIIREISELNKPAAHDYTISKN